jgi:hypothetical protein
VHSLLSQLWFIVASALSALSLSLSQLWFIVASAHSLSLLSLSQLWFIVASALSKAVWLIVKRGSRKNLSLSQI